MSDDENRDEMYREWLREETDRRMKAFYDRRPAVFDAKGELDPRVHTWLESLVQRKATSLLIVGPSGPGKSWILWKAQETLLYNGWRGRFEIVTAFELHQAISPPVDYAQLDVYAKADVLAIDDVGSLRLSDWTAEMLYGVIDQRWSNRRPTMIASNVYDLKGLLGDRIASRLADGAKTIEIDGPDRRRSA